MSDSNFVQVKKCLDCGLYKPLSQFWRRKQSRDGRSPYCKECFGLRNADCYRGRQAQAGKKVREYRPLSPAPEGMKYCARCGETQPLAAFGRNRAAKSGLTTYCLPCHNEVSAANTVKKHGSVRSYHLKRRYGLSEIEVAAWSARHGNLCLICLRRRPLHVDHDHATGEVRGLLCFRCNGALGQFKDEPRTLRGAADFLEAWQTASLGLGEGAASPPLWRPRSGTPVTSRDQWLIIRYGIGADEVERMAAEQGGLCPVCRVAEAVHVDHDHVTGAVRGVLCPECNTGMGQLRDDPWVLRRAAEYLAGGLLGLSRSGSGSFEVAVVRPRGDGEAVDVGWSDGGAVTDDLAVLDALARGGPEEPYDGHAMTPEAYEAWFAGLDLSGAGDARGA